MLISQKSHYALRGILELAKRSGQGPVKIAQIAQIQGIPPRFLEVILHQLKQAGIVDSRRGMDGGYMLAIEPGQLTVGVVIESIQGPLELLDPKSVKNVAENTASHRHPVFTEFWGQVERAISTIFQETTFQQLLERESALNDDYVASYSI